MPITDWNALLDAHNYNFANLTPIGIGDVNQDSPNARGYSPGAFSFMFSPFGCKVFQYVQNRGSAFLQGALVSAVGDNDGKTQITTSGGAGVNSKILMTTSGLTANAHQGAIAHVVNSLIGAGTPPEGEESLVSGNNATQVFIDPYLPFSATITSGDTVDLVGTYNSEAAAAGDIAAVVQGVVVTKVGVTAGNFGWVQKQGRCPNALIKAATALTQNDALIADAGRLGPAVGGTAAANLHCGYSPHVMNSDSVSDKTSVFLTLGFGFNPGTVDASA